MKGKTQIYDAVRLYRLAYCEWSALVHDVPCTPINPVITWLPGKGWKIDKLTTHDSAQQIVERYDLLMRQVYQGMKEYNRGLRAASAPRRERENRVNGMSETAPAGTH